MQSVVVSIVAFVVALGVLITVHEFGHFWVARRLGVKVLRFSIGFGRPLWKTRKGADDTEYVIAALPLGGYVKMLDEREGDVAPQELARAFNRKPVGARIAIVSAGPIFNLLFAIVAYWLMFVVGVVGAKAVVGAVEADSPAALAGFSAGDQIVSVGERSTPTWDTAVIALLDGAVGKEVVDVEVRTEGGAQRVRSLDLQSRGDLIAEGDLLANIGIRPWRPTLPPVIDKVEPDGAAARAGLAAGDRIVSVDGQGVEDWEQWVEVVRTRPGERLQVEVEGMEGRRTVELRPDRMEVDGETIGRIGAYGRIPEGAFEDMRAEYSYGPAQAIGAAVAKTGQMSLLTLRMLWTMLMGEASVKNISGPISIAQYAGQSASIGLAPFLSFLALVSISLGVLNLLPIPILDGGHLMYYLIELVKGSPVSEQTQALGQRVGIAVLLALMMLAFYNDLARLLG